MTEPAAQIRRSDPGPGALPMVLMYHSVAPYVRDPYLVTVRPERFERQLRWLRRHGLRGTSMRELLDARRAGDGRGLVGLTFDDGYADFVDHALPALERHGFGATVFVLAGRLGGHNAWDQGGERKPLMTAEQVREVATAGIEIGSHGLRHVSLPSVTGDRLAAEVRDSRGILELVAGTEVTGFCYPYGHVDADVVHAVRAAGYGYACAIRPAGLTGTHALPRTYVGDADGPLRLVAKRYRHRLGLPRSSVAASRPVERPRAGRP